MWLFGLTASYAASPAQLLQDWASGSLPDEAICYAPTLRAACDVARPRGDEVLEVMQTRELEGITLLSVQLRQHGLQRQGWVRFDRVADAWRLTGVASEQHVAWLVGYDPINKVDVGEVQRALRLGTLPCEALACDALAPLREMVLAPAYQRGERASVQAGSRYLLLERGTVVATGAWVQSVKFVGGAVGWDVPHVVDLKAALEGHGTTLTTAPTCGYLARSTGIRVGRVDSSENRLVLTVTVGEDPPETWLAEVRERGPQVVAMLGEGKDPNAREVVAKFRDGTLDACLAKVPQENGSAFGKAAREHLSLVPPLTADEAKEAKAPAIKRVREANDCGQLPASERVDCAPEAPWTELADMTSYGDVGIVVYWRSGWGKRVQHNVAFYRDANGVYHAAGTVVGASAATELLRLRAGGR